MRPARFYSRRRSHAICAFSRRRARTCATCSPTRSAPGGDIDRNTFDFVNYGTGRVRLRADLDAETGQNLAQEAAGKKRGPIVRPRISVHMPFHVFFGKDLTDTEICELIRGCCRIAEGETWIPHVAGCRLAPRGWPR